MAIVILILISLVSCVWCLFQSQEIGRLKYENEQLISDNMDLEQQLHVITELNKETAKSRRSKKTN